MGVSCMHLSPEALQEPSSEEGYCPLKMPSISVKNESFLLED